MVVSSLVWRVPSISFEGGGWIAGDRLCDEQGRLVALRMRRRQFQTFANNMDELAEVLDE